MAKNIIKVHVDWCENNFCATLDSNVTGAVVVAADSFAELQEETQQALRFHIEGLQADGTTLPKWLTSGNYQLQWTLTTAALLHRAILFTTFAAIGRATSINEKQISHYASGTKKPRPQQQQRIIEGLHKIGQELAAFA